MQTQMKRCTKCGTEYPATTEFWHKKKGSPDGLRSVCKPCRILERHSRYESNKEKTKDQVIRWRKDNPEKWHKINKRWYVNTAQWVKQHPEAEPNKRARKLGRPVGVTASDIRFAHQYFGGLCAVCGKQTNGLFVDPHLDHWIALSRPDSPGSVSINMLPLCSHCNQSKSNRDPYVWLVSQFGKRKSETIKNRINDYFSSLKDRDSLEKS